MTTKRTRRSLAVMLIAALLLPSCTSEKAPDPVTDTASTEAGKSDTTAAEIPETPAEPTLEELYPLPEVNYDGKTYDMLVVRTGYWGQDYNDLYLEEDNVADTVGSAAYQRALKIENEYGVKFVQTEADDAVAQMYRYYRAGDDTYELVHGRAVYMMPTLASTGALHDIYTLPGLHLDAPWYNQEMNKSSSILGHLYMIGGDAIVTDKTGTLALLYNKQMAVDYKLPDMYETVTSGKWTLDLMQEYGSLVTDDVNGDGKLSKNDDRFGLLAEDFFGWVFMVGCGQTIAVKDEEDVPYFTAGSEAAVDAVEKIQSIMYNEQFRHKDFLYEDDYSSIFGSNRALFMGNAMSTFATYRDMETDYGIIPLPKFDENQETYFSTFSPHVSRMVGFPRQNADTEFMGTVFDLLSRYGTDTVKSAYYDVLLSGKVARDEKSTEMLDIIFDNMVHDIGATYNWGNCWFTYNNHFGARSDAWVSTWTRVEKAAQKALDNTLKQIRKVTGETDETTAETTAG